MHCILLNCAALFRQKTSLYYPTIVSVGSTNLQIKISFQLALFFSFSSDGDDIVQVTEMIFFQLNHVNDKHVLKLGQQKFMYVQSKMVIWPSLSKSYKGQGFSASKVLCICGEIPLEKRYIAYYGHVIGSEKYR